MHSAGRLLPLRTAAVATHLCCSAPCREQLLRVTAERDALLLALQNLGDGACEGRPSATASIASSLASLVCAVADVMSADAHLATVEKQGKTTAGAVPLHRTIAAPPPMPELPTFHELQPNGYAHSTFDLCCECTETPVDLAAANVTSSIATSGGTAFANVSSVGLAEPLPLDSSIPAPLPVPVDCTIPASPPVSPRPPRDPDAFVISRRSVKSRARRVLLSCSDEEEGASIAAVETTVSPPVPVLSTPPAQEVHDVGSVVDGSTPTPGVRCSGPSWLSVQGWSRRIVLSDSEDEERAPPQHPQRIVLSDSGDEERATLQRPQPQAAILLDADAAVVPGNSLAASGRRRVRVISLLSDSDADGQGSAEDHCARESGQGVRSEPERCLSQNKPKARLAVSSSSSSKSSPERRSKRAAPRTIRSGRRDNLRGHGSGTGDERSSEESDSDLDGFIVPDSSCDSGSGATYSEGASGGSDNDNEYAPGGRERDPSSCSSSDRPASFRIGRRRVDESDIEDFTPQPAKGGGMSVRDRICSPGSSRGILSTPSKETPAALRRPALIPSWTQQKRGLRVLAPQLFREYNQLVFANQLPLELQLVWNPKLQRTAGYCAFITRGGKREARIELSEKVLDSEDRLRKTLAHEMCHAAQWLVDGVSKPPHGAAFWRWANIFTRHVPEMEVSTCHSYEIYYKFRYSCSSCANTFGRQTKSVDLARQCCARCKGKLALLGAFNRDGTQMKEREPTPFAHFVKANFGPLKKARPGDSHKELMAELGQWWKDGKEGGDENLSENLERALRL